MDENTKISDLTVGEFRQIMQECLHPASINADADLEVERLRQAFRYGTSFSVISIPEWRKDS